MNRSENPSKIGKICVYCGSGPGTDPAFVEAGSALGAILAKNGIGLVFIMDRLVKAQQMGCLYVVFFDVSTRKVVLSERIVTAAGGAGFRNFWFKPIKTAVAGLPKQYKQVTAKK